MASFWLYDPDVCDGKPCIGDCDTCGIWEQGRDLENVHICRQLSFKQTANGRKLAQSYAGPLEAMGYEYRIEESTQSIVIKWGYTMGYSVDVKRGCAVCD